MSEDRYEVVYVDKFTDMLEANLARETIQKIFGLAPRHLALLNSGKPVVIKKKVALDEAERYQQAIKNAGGVAWVQELGPDGIHIERRQLLRRQLRDRRAVYRASSILPDRRQSGGRRSTDKVLTH